MRGAGLGPLIGLSVFIFVLFWVNPLTIVPFIVYGGLTWGVARLTLNAEHTAQHMAVFTAYAFITLGIYLAQLWTQPAYYGFSGGFGVGSDDSFFYSLVARSLPDEFPFRAGRFIPDHNFAHMLRVPARIIWALGGRLHPLDLLLFNAAGLAALPTLTRALGLRVGLDARASNLAFLFTAVCPFMMLNGLILVRDGWEAVLFTGGLLAVVVRRWPLAVALTAATFWLRSGTGLLLVGTEALLAYADVRHWARYAYPSRALAVRVVLAGVLGLVVAAVVVNVMGTSEFSFFRSDFIASTLTRSVEVDEGPSSFYTIMKLPVFLRVPLGFVFYWGSPFLSLRSLNMDGIWVPRMFLSNLFSLLFLFYAAWFLRGVIRIVQDRRAGMVLVLIAVFVGILILSQASMQLRHKTVVMPLFYLVVAAGLTRSEDRYRTLGWLFSLGLFVFSGALNVYQLF